MAHYFDSTGMKTRDLLLKVTEIASHGERAVFLAPSTDGEAITLRMRVSLSKLRRRWEREGKRVAKYTIRQEISTITERGTGLRRDMVVMWIEKNESHAAAELLEDLIRQKAVA